MLVYNLLCTSGSKAWEMKFDRICTNGLEMEHLTEKMEKDLPPPHPPKKKGGGEKILPVSACFLASASWQVTQTTQLLNKLENFRLITMRGRSTCISQPQGVTVSIKSGNKKDSLFCSCHKTAAGTSTCNVLHHSILGAKKHLITEQKEKHSTENTQRAVYSWSYCK